MRSQLVHVENYDHYNLWEGVGHVYSEYEVPMLSFDSAVFTDLMGFNKLFVDPVFTVIEVLTHCPVGIGLEVVRHPWLELREKKLVVPSVLQEEGLPIRHRSVHKLLNNQNVQG